VAEARITRVQSPPIGYGRATATAPSADGYTLAAVDRSQIAVSPADEDRLSALAPVFGRAFVDEAMMCWPMGDAQDAAERFTRCFAFFLEVALGLGLVSEAGTASGAAVWIPPDQFASWDDHPWNQPRIRALTDDGGRRYDEFWRWVDTHTSSEPLWQLDSIAVEPRLQGRGYGGALIVEGQARARADGVGAFLSTGTARNVSLYQKYGFRVTDDACAPGNGPRIWFMRWDP
jgi:GNAT superfamily N-acetyltransferase